MDVRLPDGTIIKGVPDGMSKADLTAKLKANGYDTAQLESPAEESFPVKLGRQVANTVAGAIRGAGSIGATLMAPQDALEDALEKRMTGASTLPSRNASRRQGMTDALQTLGADPQSIAFQAGKLGGEVAGTLGAGGAVANAVTRVAPKAAAAAPNLLTAIRTSGMEAGTGNALTRIAGGAVSGGAAAGLVNPEDAATGAVVGGALPPALSIAGKAGSAVGTALRGGGVSPEVATLAKRAKELGIDIPADRLVNSKPLDAVASGLNYVPFSGRAATEAKMAEQLNRAGSRLMGQDTPNINKALRAASADLGAKFDATLKSTGVLFDKQLLDEAAAVYNTAERELGSDALKPIAAQIDELVQKGASGVIDGQAAYNIKRALDRIGNGNTPTAYHALELKRVLMDALNRSLGPDGAKAFAQTRQQYGNMLAFEKLAKNGVEGEISVARLANLRNINNEPLQELADIAAQFVKAREGQHGAMQRGAVALGVGGAAGLPALAATVAGGRATNAALNSNAMRALVMGGQAPNALELLTTPARLGIRSAPVLAADR